MPRIYVLFLAALLPLVASAQIAPSPAYRYTIDLVNITDDKVKVSVSLPELSAPEAIFTFPAVIPGSYERKDYGRFIEKVVAYDETGKVVKVQRKGDNDVILKPANRIRRLEYEVNDTWDATESRFVFQPGGSNIEAARHVLLNYHAFCGYVVGRKNEPFEVTVTQPKSFITATALDHRQPAPGTTVFSARTYDELVDNPVMCGLLDTLSFTAGGARVEIAVYSGTRAVTAEQIGGYLRPLAKALERFFGRLPVDHYHFLFYFTDEPPKENRGGFGALEHPRSSVYYLPEIAFEPRLKEMVNEVSAHEFLHILTPLNLRSREIADFDFRNPKMSQHLWMYEGTTEYFSWLAMMQDSVVTTKQFFGEMRTKLSRSIEFVPMSFTEMSRNVLDPKYHKNYLNVYQKGALLNLALDLKIISLTKGAKNLRSVMMELAQAYGPNKPFDDDALFGEIVARSHPEIATFFRAYVEGVEQLPLRALLEPIGWDYVPEAERSVFYLGKLALGFKEVEGLLVFEFQDVDTDNRLGVKEGDELLMVESDTVTSQNVRELFGRIGPDELTGSLVRIQVRRKGEVMTLSGLPARGYVREKFVFRPLDEASLTDDQRRLREVFFTGRLRSN